MVAVVVKRVDDVAADVRIRIGAVTDRPTGFADVEAAVEGSFVTPARRTGGRGAGCSRRRPGRLDPRDARVPAGPHGNARRARAAPRVGASGMTEITLTVNGRTVVEDVEPRLLLTDFLRHRLGLTGTHVGCEHGVCGACTVRLDGVSVRGLLHPRRPGRRVGGRDGRVARGRRAALPASGGVQAPSRPPVRLLHARDPDRSRRSPVPWRPVPRGDRRHALRATVPLHGLRPDRRRDRGSS